MLDPQAIQQINFIQNLECTGNKAMLLIIKEVKETILDLWYGTVRVLHIHFENLFDINIIWINFTA